jgi:hypothetical protein
LSLFADALDIMQGCGTEKVRITGKDHPINLNAVNCKLGNDHIEFLRCSENLHPAKCTADRARFFFEHRNNPFLIRCVCAQHRDE